jgi:hypothetical protein
MSYFVCECLTCGVSALSELHAYGDEYQKLAGIRTKKKFAGSVIVLKGHAVGCLVREQTKNLALVEYPPKEV